MSSEKDITDYLRDIGPLRLGLGLLVAVLIVFSPSPEMETVRTGWGLVRTGVLPALGPVAFMVTLFDMLMSRVLMSDQQGEARARYRRVLWFDGGLALCLLLSWLPFLIALLQAR